MNIQEYQALENLFQQGGDQVSETMKTLVRERLTYVESKSAAFQDPFKWFYEDVIEGVLAFRFNEALGNRVYSSASVDAEVCLHMGLEVRKMEVSLIFNWVNAALKTIDHVIVHYVQDHLNEQFRLVDKFGIETSRYMQLASKPDPLGTSGVLLKEIYSIHRNANEHRTRDNGDGTISLSQPDKHKCKREALKFFKKALQGILETYKNEFPHCIIPN